MKMVLSPKATQKVWFTSDTHYNHANICSGTTEWKASEKSSRDFNTLELMNTQLVSNINQYVGEDDILFHLGDWSFGGHQSIKVFRDKIICKQIHLVLGNHDHHISKNKGGVRGLFTSVNEYLELVIRCNGEKHSFVLMHYPIASWNGMSNGAIHLHGHVHLPSELRVGSGKSLDVGCDGNNLTPIQLEDIIQLMQTQPVDNLSLRRDHHVQTQPIDNLSLRCDHHVQTQPIDNLTESRDFLLANIAEVSANILRLNNRNRDMNLSLESLLENLKKRLNAL